MTSSTMVPSGITTTNTTKPLQSPDLSCLSQSASQSDVGPSWGPAGDSAEERLRVSGSLWDGGSVSSS